MLDASWRPSWLSETIAGPGLAQTFETAIEQDSVYDLLRPWLARRLSPVQAVDPELLDLAARAVYPALPSEEEPLVTSDEYATVWRAERAFRAAGDLCPTALEFLGEVAFVEVLPLNATLDEMHAHCRRLGLSRAGWKWIVANGTNAISTVAMVEPDLRPRWQIGLAMMATAGIDEPAPGFVLLDALGGEDATTDDLAALPPNRVINSRRRISFVLSQA